MRPETRVWQFSGEGGTPVERKKLWWEGSPIILPLYKYITVTRCKWLCVEVGSAEDHSQSGDSGWIVCSVFMSSCCLLFKCAGDVVRGVYEVFNL